MDWGCKHGRSAAPFVQSNRGALASSDQPAQLAPVGTTAWIMEAEMVQDNVHVTERPSLYDRLGGVYNIATVIDDFIDRVMVDPRLNANPRVNEAHHRVTAAGFKFLVTELACSAAGGPQTYSGRSMGDSIGTS